mmetsp:Transcript_72677/g.168385  ORF Transcript_72677/g.168385 Transcript_72677/m.168385 type:complete len:317 (+) Transcript_72677:90-1040(+)
MNKGHHASPCLGCVYQASAATLISATFCTNDMSRLRTRRSIRGGASFPCKRQASLLASTRPAAMPSMPMISTGWMCRELCRRPIISWQFLTEVCNCILRSAASCPHMAPNCAVATCIGPKRAGAACTGMFSIPAAGACTACAGGAGVKAFSPGAGAVSAMSNSKMSSRFVCAAGAACVGAGAAAPVPPSSKSSRSNTGAGVAAAATGAATAGAGGGAGCAAADAGVGAAAAGAGGCEARPFHALAVFVRVAAVPEPPRPLKSEAASFSFAVCAEGSAACVTALVAGLGAVGAGLTSGAGGSGFFSGGGGGTPPGWL